MVWFGFGLFELVERGVLGFVMISNSLIPSGLLVPASSSDTVSALAEQLRLGEYYFVKHVTLTNRFYSVEMRLHSEIEELKNSQRHLHATPSWAELFHEINACCKDHNILPVILNGITNEQQQLWDTMVATVKVCYSSS